MMAFGIGGARMRGMRGKAPLGALREHRAQATVEMAVVAPVLIVTALIVYNVMVFACASARFDAVAPEIVLTHGATPASGEDGAVIDASDIVAAHLEDAMEGYDVGIEVSCVAGCDEGSSLLALVGAQRTYRCVMRYAPWPSSFSLAGVPLGAPVHLVHERSMTVDPWRPGVVL